MGQAERIARRRDPNKPGHRVPAERILARYPRTLANLTQAVRLADAAVLYDSQDVSPGTHRAVPMCKGTWAMELVQPLPKWAQQVLGTK